jgi:hypothetical protein
MPPSESTKGQPPSPEKLLINAVYDIINCIWQIYVQLMFMPPLFRMMGLVLGTRQYVEEMRHFTG